MLTLSGYCDMRLDTVLDFGFGYMVIRLKHFLPLLLKAALQYNDVIF